MAKSMVRDLNPGISPAIPRLFISSSPILPSVLPSHPHPTDSRRHIPQPVSAVLVYLLQLTGRLQREERRPRPSVCFSWLFVTARNLFRLPRYLLSFLTSLLTSRYLFCFPRCSFATPRLLDATTQYLFCFPRNLFATLRCLF
jgi:hypothetical protein